jgi:mono/diheme cytochrome c family protein
MKTSSDPFTQRQPRGFRSAGLGLALAASLIWFASGTPVAAEDSTNAVAQAASAAKPADAPPAKPAEPAHNKLTGVELYAIHCNRCHPERYPVEFNQTQWKTLMLHMRVRANLPADQAREILKYLQEEAGD